MPVGGCSAAGWGGGVVLVAGAAMTPAEYNYIDDNCGSGGETQKLLKW